MLSTNPQLRMSEYSSLYDIIIPKDHKLRKAHDLVDFSFIYDELKSKYCHDNGRMAKDPVRLFKYLFLKAVYDLSDVGVVERSRTDMSFKLFLDMTPEEEVIDPSTLTKFRKLRLNDGDLLNMLLSKSVAIAVKYGIIKTSTIIVDSTHTRSRSNPSAPLEMLRRRIKELLRAMNQIDKEAAKALPKKNTDDDLVHEMDYTQQVIDQVAANEGILNIPIVKEKLDMLRETLDDIADHYTTSLKDRDARVGYKSPDAPFYGYKTHEAMTPEGIITAATVTSGEVADGPMLQQLVEQSRQNGVGVNTVIGDTAYSGDKNLKLAADEEDGFALVARVNPMLQGGNMEKEDGFIYNKDANTCVCPAGHMAKTKRLVTYRPGKGNQRVIFGFDRAKCSVCAHRGECLKGRSNMKTYSVSLRTPEQEAQMAFQETDMFKAQARMRYKIEQRFSHLKNLYGYDRANSYGLSGMQMQAAVTIFSANIMKIIRLI